MFTLVKALLGALVWLVANVVYADLRRKGIHGFTRFAAFWAGTPTTWITLFAVKEGGLESFSVEDDDGQRLLAEIRRDRALNPGTRTMDGDEPATGEPAVDDDSTVDDAPTETDDGAASDPSGNRGAASDPPADRGGTGWAPLARSPVE